MRDTWCLGTWSFGTLALLMVFFLSGGVYRLVFHPLASFPGPKKVAISGLYEFYHDAIEKGRCFHEIDKMHSKYGATPNRDQRSAVDHFAPSRTCSPHWTR